MPKIARQFTPCPNCGEEMFENGDRFCCEFCGFDDYGASDIEQRLIKENRRLTQENAALLQKLGECCGPTRTPRSKKAPVQRQPLGHSKELTNALQILLKSEGRE